MRSATASTMRRRLVGGLACLLALSVLINFAVLALLVLPGFSEIERQQAEQSLARVQDALRHDLDHVGSLANDYAVWDATWSYIQKPNDAYLYENYSAVPLENLGVDIVVLLDATVREVPRRDRHLGEGQHRAVAVDDDRLRARRPLVHGEDWHGPEGSPELGVAGG